MLGKQEALISSAISTFVQGNQRSVLCWNSLLAAYARHGETGLAVVGLFQEMQQQGVLPNRVSFILTLSSLLDHTSHSLYGKRIHACIQSCSFRSHVIVGTSLFGMYGRCGNLEAAWNVFNDMSAKDIIAWNAMLSLYADHGLCREALRIFITLLNEGTAIPNTGTYVSFLGTCTHQADINLGRLVHSLLTENMFEIDIVTATSIINMYGKCASIEDTWLVFTTMPVRNVITWNSIIYHFIQNGQNDRALELYHQMQSEGFPQDNTTLVIIFGACTSHGRIAEGEWLLACIINCTMKLDVTVGNAVLNMFGKCGKLESTIMIWNVLEQKNVWTWTTMISVYTQTNHCELALDCYRRMLRSGVYPNQVTFISVLDACASSGDFKQGRLVHEQIIEDGCDSKLSLCNDLICMYGKCCSLHDACNIFNRIQEPDIFSWNSMISACLKDSGKALGLFTQMLSRPSSPNMFTYVSMFDVCSMHFAIEEGKHMNAMVIECCLEKECIVGTALINMYSNFSMLQDAQKAFDMILEHNVISWTAMITAYARQNQAKEAFHLFDEMQAKGVKPNNVTFTSILASVSSMETAVQAQGMCHRILNSGVGIDVTVGNSIITLYGKCGSFECSRMAFYKMVEKDIVSWNAIISVYAEHCPLHEVSLLLNQMVWEGFAPDKITFLSVIHACSRQLAILEGKQFHCCMLELGILKDHMIATAMMGFYGKCGSVNDTLVVFNNMQQRDVVSWTVAILACAKNGKAKEGMQLYDQMQQDGVTPNEVTFSNVINACSHAGLFQDGLECFTSMMKNYSISPEVSHYISIIDLLGRAGQIHQADNLIGDMPFQPNTVPYLSLVGACRQPSDLLQGVQAAAQAIELDSR